MNKRMPLRVNSISRAAAAWLAGLAFFLGAICSTPAFSQTETVVAQGRTDVCYESRDMAIRLARVDATNDANRECRALGIGWSYSGMQFAGYEQCFSCKSAGFKCAVTQAIHICTNPQKEREEKAAKARAEKEAADKAAKAKADEIAAKLRVEKAAKERVDKEAAVREAKAKADRIAEKQRADKAAKERVEKEAAVREAKAKADRIAEKQGADKAAKEQAESEARRKVAQERSETAAKAAKEKTDQSQTEANKAAQRIDAAFAKVETYRAEQERQRLADPKGRQEREKREHVATTQPSAVANSGSTGSEIIVYRAKSNHPIVRGLRFTQMAERKNYVRDAPDRRFARAKEKCSGTINGETGWRLPTPDEIGQIGYEEGALKVLNPDRVVTHVWTSKATTRNTGPGYTPREEMWIVRLNNNYHSGDTRSESPLYGFASTICVK